MNVVVPLTFVQRLLTKTSSERAFREEAACVCARVCVFMLRTVCVSMGSIMHVYSVYALWSL